MKKAPNIYTLKFLQTKASECQACINGKWVPCRSEGLATLGNRLRVAWLVFTGKADAVTWPEGQ